METRAGYTLVGAFTLLIIMGALFFVSWSARDDKRGMRTYEIEFHQSVSGLTVGSPVLLEGVRIGQVSSIKVSPTGPGTVLVQISAHADAPIREDSEATLEPQGVTGVSAVAVSGGSADRAFLANYEGSGTPRIPSRISRLQEIMNSVPSILSKLDEVAGRVNGVFAPKNLESVETLVNSLSAVSLTLAENREAIAQGLRGFGQAGESFAASGKQLERMIASSQSLLDKDFRGAARSVDQAAARFDKFVGVVEPGLTRFSRESADELHRLLVEARRLMGSLATIARKLESDPRSILFGNTVPEFSVP